MKPSIPKGTRDFLPSEVYKREYIFNKIKEVFQTFGYVPIETPTMENLETLTGKYGEEGDRLLFKVLNNGDFLLKADKEALSKLDSKKLVSSISKRGLRYDLTVPFARYFVQHQNELQLPFKRYQIQPVWRADRPQRGRYHEFYQCDVDVIGSDSLMYEAELIQIYDKVFSELGLEVEVLVNNRKILYGFAEALGLEEKFMEMTISLDKLDKIGPDKVLDELEKNNIDRSTGQKLLELIGIESLEELKENFENAPTGLVGIEELKAFHGFLDISKIHNKISFDPSLARGLNYYTGCIFEVKAKGVKMGSIGGGGRYDDLTSVFGLKGISGVGVSFGFARIYDVMEELALFPANIGNKTQVLITSFNKEALHHSFKLGSILRANAISCDIYPKAVKIKKQLNYANNNSIPFVVIVGEDEIKSNLWQLKNMDSGEQKKLSTIELISFLSEKC